MKKYFFLVAAASRSPEKRERYFFLPFLTFSMLFLAKHPQSPPLGAGAVVCSDLLWCLVTYILAGSSV